MFLRHPKTDRTTWGTALNRTEPVAPLPPAAPRVPRFYQATAGSPVQAIDPESLFRHADTHAFLRRDKNPGRLRDQPGDPLTLDELQKFAPLIALGHEIGIRDRKCITINHLMEVNAARRWVHQLLLLDHDAPDGIRTIPAENWAIAMKYLVRAFRISVLLFLSYRKPGAEASAKKYFEDTHLPLLLSLLQRCVACGWPVMIEVDALLPEIVLERGLKAIY